MSVISIGLLAVSMSIDAFIASVGKGATVQRPGFGKVLRTGLIFGAVEAVTPLIGWSVGVAASQHVAKVDHWIAFALLAAVVVHMILQAFRDRGNDAGPVSSTPWATIATAIGTSLDAMVVGVSLACIETNIVLVAAAIGLSTVILSTGGMLAGRYLGQRFGRLAEVFGGSALIVLGISLLAGHLAAG